MAGVRGGTQPVIVCVLATVYTYQRYKISYWLVTQGDALAQSVSVATILRWTCDEEIEGSTGCAVVEVE